MTFLAASTLEGNGNHTEDLYDVRGTQDVAGTRTTIFFKRKLVTGDSWDVPITEGEMEVVWAMNRQGQDSFFSYHGPIRGYGRIDFMRWDATPFYTGAIGGVVLLILILWWLSRQRRVQEIFGGCKARGIRAATATFTLFQA